MFTAGQRVKLKGPNQHGMKDHKKAGDIGLVVKGRRSEIATCVKFDGWDGGHNDATAATGMFQFVPGPYWYIDDEFLEALPAIKVGDRVKIVRVEPGDRYKAGDVGVVTKDCGPCSDSDRVWALDIGGGRRVAYGTQLDAAGAPALAIGDEVEVVNVESIPSGNRPSGLPNGSKGKVCEVFSPWMGRVGVEFAGWNMGHNGGAPYSLPRNRWRFNVAHLKKVWAPLKFEPAPKPLTGKFIVVSDEGPATKPYVHTTRDAAEAEAKRLSNVVKPGVCFEVYQAVTRVFTPKPVMVETKVEALDKAA